MYNAFGENLYQWTQTTGDYDSPYRFNGKELDPETGNYYYGARYYDPKISVWLSVDPLADKFPHLTPYNFSFNNPIKFIDPDGMDPIIPINNVLSSYGRDTKENYLFPNLSTTDIIMEGFNYLAGLVGPSIPGKIGLLSDVAGVLATGAEVYEDHFRGGIENSKLSNLQKYQKTLNDVESEVLEKLEGVSQRLTELQAQDPLGQSEINIAEINGVRDQKYELENQLYSVQVEIDLVNNIITEKVMEPQQ